MIATTDVPKSAEPVLFQIWHREQTKGARWKKAGRASTHAEAITMIGGKGDWWIGTLRDARLAGEPEAAVQQPGLFD